MEILYSLLYLQMMIGAQLILTYRKILIDYKYPVMNFFQHGKHIGILLVFGFSTAIYMHNQKYTKKTKSNSYRYIWVAAS